MLKIITSLSMFLVGALAQSQVSETRKMENFSKAAVADGVELVFVHGDPATLTIEAADALSLGDLVTEVKNNTLCVYTKDALDTPVKVFLGSGGITSIEASNGSKVSVVEAIDANDLSITLASRSIFSGNVHARTLSLRLKSGSFYNGNITAQELTASLRGQAKARLSGFAKKASLSASNSSVCSAQTLFTERTALDASGNSTVTANVSGHVEVSLTEGSHISWAGYPEAVVLSENTQIVNKSAVAITGL